jgi:hypothetical protein
MADNVQITAGSGTAIAADDVSGALHQRVKLSLGADGVANDAVAGSGNADSGTQRVILASDDPAVQALDAIGGYLDGVEALLVDVEASTSTMAALGATEATLDAARDALVDLNATEYETAAAGATTTLGATGASGDYLASLLIIPATVSPGAVYIRDATTSIQVFAGGTDSLGSLTPFPVPLGIKSVSGAWSVVCGSSVAAIGIGTFT